MQLGLNSLYLLEVCKIEWELTWLDGTKMHMQNLFEGNSWYGSVIIHTNVRLDSAQSSNFYELQPIYWQCESKKNLIDVKVSIVIPYDSTTIGFMMMDFIRKKQKLTWNVLR